MKELPMCLALCVHVYVWGEQKKQISSCLIIYSYSKRGAFLQQKYTHTHTHIHIYVTIYIYCIIYENIYLYTYIYYIWASLVAQMVKNLPAMQETWVQSLGREDSSEKGRATHSSITAWRTPWIAETSRLESAGSQSDTSERHIHYIY